MTRSEFKESLAVLITKGLNEKHIDRVFILECIDEERWNLIGEIDSDNRRVTEDLYAQGLTKETVLTDKGEWRTDLTPLNKWK